MQRPPRRSLVDGKALPYLLVLPALALEALLILYPIVRGSLVSLDIGDGSYGLDNYATMLADPDLREDARHSVSEHKEVDDFLGELMELEFGSWEWDQKFGEMRHRYEHHIDEEEEEMFPTAAEKLSAETEAQLARTFEERKPKELERAEEHAPGDERE